jgi:hypothetical protein
MVALPADNKTPGKLVLGITRLSLLAEELEDSLLKLIEGNDGLRRR